MEENTKTRKSKYKFQNMEIGDSFTVNLKRGKTIAGIQSSLSSSAKSFCDRHGLDWEFKTKRHGYGVEIERTK